MKDVSFSIVMPSFLGDYPNSAMDKENKFIHAIESVIYQTYNNFELIIISDGCDKTIDLIKKISPDLFPALKVYKLSKQKLWSGIRNVGIDKAENDYIIYLDTDDRYRPEYLQDINDEIKNVDLCDWYYLDDYFWNKNNFEKRKCIINKIGNNGTSNIIHKRTMNARWKNSTYLEDFQFIKGLIRESDNYRKLNVAGYYVCHIPKLYDI